MKIIGVIPARYNSSRFPGKPLADICGKPMIWWVYQQAVKVEEFNGEVYVATDDKRIEEVCKEYDMKVIMTSDNHKTPTDRLHEASEKINADFYVCINGDEPLIDINTIKTILPTENVKYDDLYVGNIITSVKDPIEVVDFTNLKIVINKHGKGLYISRSPVPYPKGSMDYEYKKHIGVVGFTKKALDFYVNTERGIIETIEDIDLLRFIENDKDVQFIDVKCKTISVDTPKDLEFVRKVIQNNIDNKNITSSVMFYSYFIFVLFIFCASQNGGAHK